MVSSGWKLKKKINHCLKYIYTNSDTRSRPEGPWTTWALLVNTRKYIEIQWNIQNTEDPEACDPGSKSDVIGWRPSSHSLQRCIIHCMRNKKKWNSVIPTRKIKWSFSRYSQAIFVSVVHLETSILSVSRRPSKPHCMMGYKSENTGEVQITLPDLARKLNPYDTSSFNVSFY